MMMIDKLIKNLADCTGCYACYSICPKDCISMEVDAEGFWYPHIDIEECIDCGACDRVCPTFNKKEIINEPEAYACINKNEKIRLESSSGGIFSLVADMILDKNGVVFGALFDDNYKVIHNYIDTKNELYKFRGSKYVQSKIGDSFIKAKAFLDEGRLVLFSGTPCQIAGLYSFLGKDYDNLYSIDLICHGVPSPDIWEKYVNYREKEAKSKSTKISFKDKREGWKSSSQYFKFENGREYIKNIGADLYLKAFLKNICLRPSCYECQFKSIHRESDITLADFWGIENVIPEMDDNKGTSAVFINSKKGHDIFKQIECDMITKKTDINKIIAYNTAAIKSSTYNPKRSLFMQEKDSKDFDKLVNKYCIESLTLRVKRKLKNSLKNMSNK
jgi:coenzyme F420-reducing hydrogenase beta subunit